jgi:hypothetical protein
MAIRISCTFSHWTANPLALMSLAGFGLVANFRARKASSFKEFFLGHQLLFELCWVIHSVTRDHSLVFSTFALLHHQDLTSLATIRMASLFALMYTTR